MNIYKRMYKIITLFFILSLILSSFFVSFSGGIPLIQSQERNINSYSHNQFENVISVTIPISEYTITYDDNAPEILIPGFGNSLAAGNPSLPTRIFSIAIPPGSEIDDISFSVGQGMVIPELSFISPVPISQLLGRENVSLSAKKQKEYDEAVELIYSRDDPYPENVGEFVGTAGYRKYNLVDVRITPFSYHPISEKILYYPEITVDISYNLPFEGYGVIQDALISTEQIAKDIIINYNQAQHWYPHQTILRKGLYSLVIITLDNLVSSVSPLVNWEIAKGNTVNVVTVSWITENYDGYDLAEQIRNFLRDKYPSEEWGIEDVLFVGDYSDVPMRRVWQDIGYGKPDTDFYYAELSLPDNESWDANGNRRWGENSDPIDFYNEVNVGRIPWSDPDTVLHICQKSIAFEQNNDPNFKKNILLLGAFFWSNTDNAVLMEAKIDQPWMQDWTMTRMYEQGYSSFPMDYNLDYENVKTVWSNGMYSFVNWAGHGSPYACYRYYPSSEIFVDVITCTYLNDEYPSIIFADACSNSDTEYINIGKSMLKRGAVGFAGATKVALGQPGWSHPSHGSSQSLDYFFTTYVTSGEYTQGEALQKGLREMYLQGLWTYLKYETFIWAALWGSPTLSMAPIENAPVFEIEDIMGGFGRITASALNIGTVEATDVNWNIDVKGGIFQLVDKHSEGYADAVGIHEAIDIQTHGLLFGFGKIDIKIVVSSSVKTCQAILIGPFVYII
ncbi:MAG: C25 family cysteine peptidase [Thermoplasmatota archaeon]